MSKFSQTWSVLHVAFRESVRPQNILVALIGLLGTICIWHAAGSALLPLDELQEVSPVKVSRPVEVSKTLEPKKPVAETTVIPDPVVSDELATASKPAESKTGPDTNSSASSNSTRESVPSDASAADVSSFTDSSNPRVAEAMVLHRMLASAFSGTRTDPAEVAGDQPNAAKRTALATWFSSVDVSDRPIHCVEVYARFAEPGRRLFLVGHTWKSFLYYIVGGVLSVLIWAFAGLPIARSTVVRVAQSSASPSKASLNFGRTKGFDVFGAIALPMVGIAMMAIPIVALGFLMRLDVGVFIAGLLWILVAIVSCFMAILAVGLFAGWPLMWGAVAADDADSFDAISRSYAYALQRPLNYIGYLLISVALGTVGYLAAWGGSEMAVQLCYWCAQLGAGPERMSQIIDVVNSTASEATQSSMITVAAQIIHAVNTLVRYLASAYSFSFFFSAMTAIYMLLRRDTDETEIDQICGPDDPASEPSAAEA